MVAPRSRVRRVLGRRAVPRWFAIGALQLSLLASVLIATQGPGPADPPPPPPPPRHCDSLVRVLDPDGSIRWGAPIAPKGWTASTPRAGEPLVLADADRIVAVDPELGVTLWERREDVEEIWQGEVGVIAQRSLAYGYQEVISLDPSDGAVRWRLVLEPREQLRIKGRWIYSTSGNGLTVYDPATGAARWSLPATGWSATRRVDQTLVMMHGVVATDDKTVVVSSGSDVTARDLADGRVLWSVPLDHVVGLQDVEGLVVASRSFEQQASSEAIVLDGRDGTERSRAHVDIEDVSIHAVEGGALVGVTGQLSFVEAGSGRVRWTIARPGEPWTLLLLGSTSSTVTHLDTDGRDKPVVVVRRLADGREVQRSRIPPDRLFVGYLLGTSADGDVVAVTAAPRTGEAFSSRLRGHRSIVTRLDAESAHIAGWLPDGAVAIASSCRSS